MANYSRKACPAVQELHSVVPDLFYAQTEGGQNGEEAIIRVPEGLEGVLKVAVEKGFLLENVAKLALFF